MAAPRVAICTGSVTALKGPLVESQHLALCEGVRRLRLLGEHCASTPLQTEISIHEGVNFGIHRVSACLGYLLPEPFTYALYFVIAILFLVIYLAIT